jgi:xanthine dehydrogenase accessory factor
MLAEGVIPVLVDPEGEALQVLRPSILVDARMQKVNLGTTKDDAPLVIGLGPGFTAGSDCHAVVETNRGHHLGRVYWRGSAEPNTGTPGAVNGRTGERVLRAPVDGAMLQVVPAGVFVREGALLARIGGAPVFAPFDGVLRGLVDEDVFVLAGTKIGDLDPRARREFCFTISDKSLAVGGGVVEAIFSAPQAGHLLRRVAAASEARS